MLFRFLEQPVELLRNDLTRRGTSNPGVGQTSNANADAEGNYLLIDLIGRRANRDAIGSWVEVEWGGETRIKHRYGGGSYASTHASTLHIGLGKATSQAAAKVTVHWVGGKVETFADIRPNQRVILLESSE